MLILDIFAAILLFYYFNALSKLKSTMFFEVLHEGPDNSIEMTY